jgi:hypothetical protein
VLKAKPGYCSSVLLDNLMANGWNLPEASSAWAEVERLHVPINRVDMRRGLIFGDLAQHYAEHRIRPTSSFLEVSHEANSRHSDFMYLLRARGMGPSAGTCINNWSEFHRTNMQRWNPCEKVLGVNNVGRLRLKWSRNIRLVRDSPAVANGVVYIGSQEDNTFALRASTGAKLWSYLTGGGRSSPAVANGVVYRGSGNNVYALNASTGALLWSSVIGNTQLSSPTEANGVVYIVGGSTPHPIHHRSYSQAPP